MCEVVNGYRTDTNTLDYTHIAYLSLSQTLLFALKLRSYMCLFT
ncbi:hypothetical protein PQD69_gp098 [Carnobacterium phage cd4]|uniref:Uncharacterized protein n=1 Tax=Carnobacterium phage cd4 TaxID=2849246 RepID=A0AAE7STE4_9CAUD|nr:hypothetical protein PQD69_gp098 [Carnobacterium phage cd4]QXP45412.1 hypothetical protein cd4_098 [Carnobacterium phage cd4]